jgi:hypothetical protein
LTAGHVDPAAAITYAWLLCTSDLEPEQLRHLQQPPLWQAHCTKEVPLGLYAASRALLDTHDVHLVKVEWVVEAFLNNRHCCNHATFDLIWLSDATDFYILENGKRSSLCQADLPALGTWMDARLLRR